MQVGDNNSEGVLTLLSHLKRYLSRCLLAICCLVSALHAERHEFRAPVMGTQAEMTCYSADRDSVEAAWNDVKKRWEEAEQILSDYRADSEIMRLAVRQQESLALGTPVSSELFQLLETCHDLSHRSDGAFDVTVGPLSRLWRQARRNGTMPPVEKLAKARAAVGYQFLELDRSMKTVRFLKPGMRLDFGAIGKGYAADLAIETLHQHGIRQALVNLGGDLAIGDAPPQSQGWRIGVGLQRDGPSPMVANCGIATSGDSHRGLLQDGIRRSHILDPRTGEPLTDSWSVTVIADNGTLADALASILSVLGPDAGPPWLDREFPSVSVQFHRP